MLTVKPFADSLLRALRAQLAPLAATPLAPLLAHPSDRHDWMRALLRSPQGPAAAPALRLLCEASRVRADALAWLDREIERCAGFRCYFP